MNTLINGLLLLIFLFASHTNNKKYAAIGTASYYSKKFDGKRTASGEIFDSQKFTAAHRILAFNTIVKVTNLKNGKIVKVKINDRGPHTKNRLIDLSFIAAQEIGLIEKGTAKVKIEIDGEMDTSPITDTLVKHPLNKDLFERAPGKIYDIRGNEISLKAFSCRLIRTSNEKRAKKFLNKIESEKIYPCYLKISGSYLFTTYEILTGTFASKTEAKNFHIQLKKSGYNNTVIQLKK